MAIRLIETIKFLGAFMMMTQKFLWFVSFAHCARWKGRKRSLFNPVISQMGENIPDPRGQQHKFVRRLETRKRRMKSPRKCFASSHAAAAATYKNGNRKRRALQNFSLSPLRLSLNFIPPPLFLSLHSSALLLKGKKWQKRAEEGKRERNRWTSSSS